MKKFFCLFVLAASAVGSSLAQSDCTWNPDFDGDYAITVTDLLAFMTAYGEAAPDACPWNPDVDGDGFVNITDLLSFFEAFGEIDADADGVFDSMDDCVGTLDEEGNCEGMSFDALQITVHPSGQIHCANSISSAPLTIEVTGGSGLPTFQWQSAQSEDGPWTPIDGATYSNFSVPDDLTASTYFRCVVADIDAEVTSSSALIEVIPALEFTTIWPDIEGAELTEPWVCQGTQLDPAVVVFSGQPFPPSSYQWYMIAEGVGSTPIAGQTAATFTPPTDAVGTVGYACAVSTANGCTTLGPIQWVHVVPALTVNVTPPYACSIANVLSFFYDPFTAVTEGGAGNLSYQWSVDGLPWEEGNSDTFYPPLFDSTAALTFLEIQVEVVGEGLGCESAVGGAWYEIWPEPLWNGHFSSPFGGGTRCLGGTSIPIGFEVAWSESEFFEDSYWESSPNPDGPWQQVAGSDAPIFTPPSSEVGLTYYRLVGAFEVIYCSIGDYFGNLDFSEPIAVEVVDCASDPCGGESVLDYNGHDYDLVEIGDQCWFQENLQADQYANGDPITGGLTSEEWLNTTEGAQAVFGEGSIPCELGCDEVANLSTYGRLYNGYALTDARGVCPVGWHVSTDADWIELEMGLGMSASTALSTGFRGTQGEQLKASPSDIPDWDGDNASGFKALPGGDFGGSLFWGADSVASFWSYGPAGTSQIGGFRSRGLTGTFPEISRSYAYSPNAAGNYGHSIRCVKDD